MKPVILLTGFGPFPGAPFNPTDALVKRLARMRRPALTDVTLVPHVFSTSYSAVDRELPALLAQHRPRVMLMFGLAARTPHLRIETRAHNKLARFPDAERASPMGRAILSGGPTTRPLTLPARRLLAAARGSRVPVKLSRDAGRYLCNYLCWRAAEAALESGGPRLTAFIHVPAIGTGKRRRGAQRPRLTLDDLLRAASAMLVAIAKAR